VAQPKASTVRRYCTYPNCPNLVDSGRCPAHRKQEHTDDQQWRGSASERGYGYRWTKLRAAHIASQPACVMCLEQGIVNIGSKESPNEVDHIVPLKARPDLRLSKSNLQTLCQAHHKSKTRSQ
jgi:5-methylcytosine-specific restriction protein A